MQRTLLAVLAVLVAFGVGAEESTNETLRPIGGLTFADEYELTIANVIVSVTDKKGNPVTDLTAEDFRVFQDGQVKPVTNFALITPESYEKASRVRAVLPPEAVPETDETQPQPLSMIIYIDNDNLHPLDRNRVLRYARAFVIENLRPPMQIMVVSTTNQVLEILQSFTSDPGPVLDALRNIKRISAARPLRDNERRDILGRIHREIENRGRTSTFGARGFQSFHEVMNYADEESYNLMNSIEALREVVTYLAGAPGRKSILYLSNGLATIPGSDLIQAVSETFNDPSVLTELQRYDRTKWFQTVISVANAHEVSFYTVGAGGLEAVGMSAAGSLGGRDGIVTPLGSNTFLDGLKYLARDTGGMALINTNDFEDVFNRIESDLHTYYSLGYRLVRTGGDKVHHTRVTVPGHPELNLRYRDTWVEKSVETRVQERVLAALIQDLDENPMGLEVSLSGASPASGDLLAVPMFLSFPLHAVALLPEGDDLVGGMVLFVAARDADGKRSDTVREEHEIRIPASAYDAIKDKRFGIETSLLMAPGNYRIAVALLDEMTRQASYESQSITVGSP